MRFAGLQVLRAIATVIIFTACGETIVDPPPAPSKPVGLRAEFVGSASVRLTWDPVVMGNESIVYSVFRNGTKIGEVAVTEFTDTAVVSSAQNVWYVAAKTARGGVSAPSDPVIIGLADIEAPRVTAVTPASGSTGVSRLPNPLLTFSEPMIPATLAGGIKARLTSSGEPVYGTVSYNAATRTANFSPLALLPSGTNITITVSSEAKDVAGNSAMAFSFAFTTGSEPSSAETAPSGMPLLIAHSGGVGFAPDIFKWSLDGQSAANITQNPATDRDGAWSPDGRHVAFSSDRNGTFDIFIMRDDGSGLRQLTFEDKDQLQPRWSSDGKRLVFLSSKEGSPPAAGYNTPFDVWMMNADGTGQQNLTRTPTAYEFWPQWSPDGARLTFTRTELFFSGEGQNSGSATRIMIAEADATNAVPLVPLDPAINQDVASWSPDGRRIAFSSRKFTGDVYSETFVLFTIAPDGSDLRPLTTTGARRFPSWSPDSRSLAVSFSPYNEFWARFGQVSVYTMNVETLESTQVAPHTPRSDIMSPQAWRR